MYILYTLRLTKHFIQHNLYKYTNIHNTYTYMLRALHVGLFSTTLYEVNGACTFGSQFQRLVEACPNKLVLK